MAERVLELRVPARAGELKHVRIAVRSCAEAAGMGETGVQDVVMAVDEACQNVIRHAYGEEGAGDMLLEVDRDDDTLVFCLKDFAPPVDPTQVKPRDLEEVRPGGLGTHLPQVQAPEHFRSRLSPCQRKVEPMPVPDDRPQIRRPCLS